MNNKKRFLKENISILEDFIDRCNLLYYSKENVLKLFFICVANVRNQNNLHKFFP